MDLEYTTSSIARPSKIDPNLDFWFVNIPSGNPADGFAVKLVSLLGTTPSKLRSELPTFHCAAIDTILDTLNAIDINISKFSRLLQPAFCKKKSF
jgi:hypothetical protein